MEAKFSASKQADIDPFDGAIADLERAAGDFLTGPGRLRCRAAFDADPEAFAFLARKALTKTGARSVLGLFVKIVADEHAHVSERLKRARPSNAPAAVVQRVDLGACFVCEETAVARAFGQLWCDTHLREELRSRGLAA